MVRSVKFFTKTLEGQGRQQEASILAKAFSNPEELVTAERVAKVIRGNAPVKKKTCLSASKPP